MVTFPFNTTDFTFTKNLDPILFSSENNSYFDTVITITYYNFYDDTENTIELENKIPLFNNFAKWFIGDVIERNIPKLNVNFQSGFQQNTTKVSITAKEILIADGTIEETVTIENVKFIPGQLPKKIESNKALLHTNHNLCKAFSNSILLVSFLIPSGNHTIDTYNNDKKIDSIQITGTDLKSTYTHSFSVNNLSVTPADKISFQINGTEIKKTFVIYPDTRNQNTVFYTSSYNLMSSIVFSGEFSFPEEFEKIAHTYRSKDNPLNEVEEIVEVLDFYFLKINTGYLMKTQLPLVTELMKSKKVIIENINNLYVEMVPKTTDFLGFDTTKFLFQFNLEFKINTKKDA